MPARWPLAIAASEQPPRRPHPVACQVQPRGPGHRDAGPAGQAVLGTGEHVGDDVDRQEPLLNDLVVGDPRQVGEAVKFGTVQRLPRGRRSA